MTPEEVIKRISDIYQIEIAVLTGRQRDRKYLEPRQRIAAALDALGLSSLQIGAIMNRHHTTVLYYLGSIPSKRKEKP